MTIAVLYLKENVAHTVFEHLYAFCKFSSHEVEYINIFDGQISLERLNSFKAIVIHYTIFLFCDDRCPPLLRVLLREADAKKIVFIQDEYRRVNDVIENLKLLNIDCLFTCVPQPEIQKVYPQAKLPNLIIKSTLTGYISEEMIQEGALPGFGEREIDVVYRARRLSAWYGTLCYDKWRIAEKFNEDAVKYSLSVDVSSSDADRIYGREWVGFLKKSKAALGVESGAGVFDFTGEIQKNVEAYERKKPFASFDEVKNIFFKNEDGKIKLNQISPRCFECAAYKTLMILYEGEYSGILKPWRHYIPLKKDHSNMEDVVNYLRDEKKWREITECVYNEVALNPLYSYQSFIENFDNVLRTEFAIYPPNDIRSSNKPQPINYTNHKLGGTSYSLRNMLFCLLNWMPKRCGEFLEEFLRKVKKRVSLVSKVFVCGVHKKKLYVMMNAMRRSFCLEFKLILLLAEYSDLISQQTSKNILCLFYDPKCEKLYLTIDLDKSNKKITGVQKRGDKVFIDIPHSFLIPEIIRGKSFDMKYPQLAYDFLLDI